MELPKTSEVVIVGGGVIGTSIAYQLSRKRIGSIVLLDKDLIGSGETRNCVGGIRQQFSTRVNIELSRESVRSFKNFEVETGRKITFNKYGYLFLASTDSELEQFKKNVALQKSLGVNADLVSAGDIVKLVKEVNLDGIIGGTFCNDDGFGDPYEVTQAFASLARDGGVKFIERVRVDGIALENGGRFRVQTTEGNISTPVVVVAAGYETREISSWVGLDIPIAPYRRQIFVTEVFPDIRDTLPMVVDFHTGLYIRKESGGVLMGMADREEASSTNTNVDWDYMCKVVEEAVKRFPILEKARVMRGWAGLYDVTPDSHAVLGETGVPGFFLAAGFSGHGFMHSPVVGKVISEIVVKGKSETVDVSPLNFERFKKGKVLTEASVI